MKSSQVKKITYILELDEEEADWLSSIVKVPIGNSSLENEPKINKDMRHRFWEALHPPMVAQK